MHSYRTRRLYLCLLFFNILFPKKETFQRGWGVLIIFVENPEGRGATVFFFLRRGVLSELPSVVGVWIFSGTTHCKKTQIVRLIYCFIEMPVNCVI